MKFIKVLSFDLVNGSLKNLKLVIPAIILPLLFCIDFAMQNQALELTRPDLVPSFADYLIYVYGGMKVFVPSATNIFYFPVIWMLYFLAPAYALLDYPFHNVQTFGQQVIVRTESRSVWWLSKSVWNMLSTILFHLISILIVYSFCLVAGVQIEGTIHSDLIQIIFGLDSYELPNQNIRVKAVMLVAPIIISVSLNLLQMVLSLSVKPIYSFLLYASTLISSAYCMTPTLIGNYAMVLRDDSFLENGVSSHCGIVIGSALVVLSIVSGLFQFKRYDILNKK